MSRPRGPGPVEGADGLAAGAEEERGGPAYGPAGGFGAVDGPAAEDGPAAVQGIRAYRGGAAGDLAPAFVAAFTALLALHLAATGAGWDVVRLATKPLLMPVLAGWVWAWRRRTLVAALLSGWGGDVLLEIGGTGAFLAGILCFAAGHVCYLRCSSAAGPSPGRGRRCGRAARRTPSWGGDDRAAVARPGRRNAGAGGRLQPAAHVHGRRCLLARHGHPGRRRPFPAVRRSIATGLAGWPQPPGHDVWISCSLWSSPDAAGRRHPGGGPGGPLRRGGAPWNWRRRPAPGPSDVLPPAGRLLAGSPGSPDVGGAPRCRLEPWGPWELSSGLRGARTQRGRPRVPSASQGRFRPSGRSGQPGVASGGPGRAREPGSQLQQTVAVGPSSRTLRRWALGRIVEWRGLRWTGRAGRRGEGIGGAVLIDTYGRVATDLRVSLTDRCNLRCTYCMPEEGLHWLRQARPAHRRRDRPAGPDRASPASASRESASPAASRCCVPAWSASSSACAALEPRPRISLTTNGIGLERTAAALRDAGLDRVNVSLDTLRPDVFRTLTRRDRHHDVLAGLEAAARPGSTPVKVNAVLMRGLNDDEAPELLRLGRGARLRAALHRADAARRPARLERDGHGHRRRDPRLAAHAASRSPPKASRCAAARPPSAGWSTAGRPGSA